jgi:O-acetyl-ADP-ribose deacetylase (regulator of RNase III)
LEDKKLHSAVVGSLELANKLNLASVAFPAISTGIFGFPKERAARIILEAIRSYFARPAGSTVGLVRIVLIDAATLAAFSLIWEAFFSERDS